MDLPIKEWLWPNLNTMIISMVTLLILFFIFKKFLFEKVRANLELRKEYIKNEINSADNKHKEAQTRLIEAQTKLSDAKVEAHTILSDAKVSGQRQYDETVLAASSEATRLATENREEIKSERDAMQTDIHAEIIEVAFSAASKVVEREISKKDNKKLVKDFISEVSK